MKLICTQENLTQALSALDRVVGKQSSLPILSNFLFESENGRLKISATNLEIGIMVFVGAKIEKEGKFAVPARILSQFVQNLPQGEVLELELTGSQLLLKSGSSEMKIKVLFPKGICRKSRCGEIFHHSSIRQVLIMIFANQGLSIG